MRLIKNEHNTPVKIKIALNHINDKILKKLINSVEYK